MVNSSGPSDLSFAASIFLCSDQLNRKVFCYQVASLEDNYNVYFKLNFKVVCGERWAREEPWEDHVKWDGEPAADVSLGYLNILNLRRLFKCCVEGRYSF